MVTLTNKIFNTRVVPENIPAPLWALAQIGQQPKPPMLALKLIEMRRKLEQHSKDFSEAVKEQAQNLAVKDDSGNPIMKDGDYEMTAEAREEWNKFYADLLKVEFTMNSVITREEITKLREVSEQVLEFLGDLVVLEEPAK